MPTGKREPWIASTRGGGAAHRVTLLGKEEIHRARLPASLDNGLATARGMVKIPMDCFCSYSLSLQSLYESDCADAHKDAIDHGVELYVCTCGHGDAARVFLRHTQRASSRAVCYARTRFIIHIIFLFFFCRGVKVAGPGRPCSRDLYIPRGHSSKVNCREPRQGLSAPGRLPKPNPLNADGREGRM